MKQPLPLASAVDPIAPSALTPFRNRNVYIENYGCQMNVSDSEVIASILAGAGYGSETEMRSADVILLNTCAIREKAEERVFGRLGELSSLKRKRPDLVLGVCGCMAQRIADQIAERAPYVDLVMGPDSYRNLPEAIENARGAPYIDTRLDPLEDYADIAPVRAEGVKAWLTIQRGCDKFCAFCVVPFVRGRERSVQLENVVDEARRLADSGVKEITLLGQTVNSYNDGRHDFADLLEAASEVDGIERIRFTSPHPSDATDAMIRVMGSNPKVCSHIHLPLQSGSDEVLTRMRRDYRVKEYMEVVEKLRANVAGAAITTDIIVGFPGETAAQFEETYRLMERVRYDGAFMFKYSERGGTVAQKRYADDIAEAEKIERLKRIIALQESVSAEIYAAKIGAAAAVLAEGVSKKSADDLFGKTDDFKTCVFPKDGAEIGEIVQVEIVDATPHTLIGRVVSKGG